MADVDHFKAYNDTNGHLAGDAALVKVAEILRKATRGVDSVARYGGEEFWSCCSKRRWDGAIVGSASAPASPASRSTGKVTMSIGIAEYPSHGDTPEELIASADAAMYQGKSQGRIGSSPPPGHTTRSEPAGSRGAARENPSLSGSRPAEQLVDIARQFYAGAGPWAPAVTSARS